MEKQQNDAPQISGKGSFWLSKEVVNELIASATVTQICVFLILARYTDETGQYSTCGRTGVKKALGLGDEQAQRALDSLKTLTIEHTYEGKTFVGRLMYSAEEWTNLTGEVIERPTLKSQVRFHLYPFDRENKDWIWFANTLVDGYGKFRQPLKRLKRLGEVASRLLLIMYRENKMEQFGGVPPSVAYGKYINEKQPVTSKGYQLWHATRDSAAAYPNHSLPALRLEQFSKKEDIKNTEWQPFWDAIEALQAAGFIYEVVSVLDAEPGSMDANVVYELDARNWRGYSPKGEQGLSEEMARLADYLGYPAAAGRFHANYAFILEQGVTPHIAGIFRLRFRVANPKNHTVRPAFQRIGAGQSEWRNILQGLLAPYEAPRTVQEEAEHESF